MFAQTSALIKSYLQLATLKIPLLVLCSEFLDKLQSELEKLEQSSSLVLPVKTPPKRSPKNSAVSLLNETAHLVENTFQGELISEVSILRLRLLNYSSSLFRFNMS